MNRKIIDADVCITCLNLIKPRSKYDAEMIMHAVDLIGAQARKIGQQRKQLEALNKKTIALP